MAKSRRSRKAAVSAPRRRSSSLTSLWSFIVWVAGVLVSLAVGFGMVDGTLNVTQLFVPIVVSQVAGWLVVILAVLGVILKIVDVLGN